MHKRSYHVPLTLEIRQFLLWPKIPKSAISGCGLEGIFFQGILIPDSHQHQLSATFFHEVLSSSSPFHYSSCSHRAQHLAILCHILTKKSTSCRKDTLIISIIFSQVSDKFSFYILGVCAFSSSITRKKRS